MQLADDEASIGSLIVPLLDLERKVRAALSVNGNPAQAVWQDRSSGQVREPAARGYFKRSACRAARDV